MRRLVTFAAAAASLAVLPASAQDGPTCEVSPELELHQHLRRLSLDLRGTVPTVEEYEAAEEAGVIPPELVSQWIASDEFRLAMRHYHESFLWPNVSAARLAGTNARVSAVDFGALAIQSTSRRNVYRGGTDVTSALGEQCGDFEQTHFDPAFPGQFRPDPAFIRNTPDGKRQEGWRWVVPYWAPKTKVKVCAYDAQETPETLTSDKKRTLPCSHAEVNNRRECGCGPNLAFCYSPNAAQTDTVIRNSLREQLGRSVDDVTVGGQPYTDLMLSTKAWQNGPIAHFKKHLANNYALALTYNVADPEEPLLEKPFSDATFEKVDRGGLHAGVLTLPAYLLRFQTNRARANRMRIAFECTHFVPPANLEYQQGCSTTDDDLTNRCGCQYCHTTLDPLSAHFGQFAEAGTTQLSDTARFPREDMGCSKSNASAFCRRFYVTDPEAPGTGMLLPLQFAEAHPDQQQAFEVGPRQRALELIESGGFAQCTVRRAFSWFVKREMNTQGADTSELDLLNQLGEGFEESGYSFPWLVEQIVSLPQYRRIR